MTYSRALWRKSSPAGLNCSNIYLNWTFCSSSSLCFASSFSSSESKSSTIISWSDPSWSLCPRKFWTSYSRARISWACCCFLIKRLSMQLWLGLRTPPHFGQSSTKPLQPTRQWRWISSSGLEYIVSWSSQPYFVHLYYFGALCFLMCSCYYW